MKKALLFVACISLSLTAAAQVDWAVTYTTEGHYGVSQQKAAWANLMNLDLGIGLWRNATLNLSTLSSFDTCESVSDDRQAYSNIVAENRALRLFLLELSQSWNWLELGIGIGHINNHFFATEHSALFTGASHGIYPTVGDNYGLGNFPVSSLGINADVRLTNRLHAHIHGANGAASDRLNEQFRLRPHEDGLLGIAELRWVNDPNDEHQGSWHLGAVREGCKSSGNGTTLFIYGDQPLVSWGESHAGVLLQGSWAKGNDITCRSYIGAGLWGDEIGSHHIYTGLIANRAVYVDGWETDIELTSVIPVYDWLQLQPALHLINTDSRWDTVALLRATFTWE